MIPPLTDEQASALDLPATVGGEPTTADWLAETLKHFRGQLALARDRNASLDERADALRLARFWWQKADEFRQDLRREESVR